MNLQEMEQMQTSISEWVANDQGPATDEDLEEWMDAVEANDERRRQLLEDKKELKERLAIIDKAISESDSLRVNGTTGRCFESGLSTAPAHNSSRDKESQPMDTDECSGEQQFGTNDEILNITMSPESQVFGNSAEDDNGIFASYDDNRVQNMTVLEPLSGSQSFSLRYDNSAEDVYGILASNVDNRLQNITVLELMDILDQS